MGVVDSIEQHDLGRAAPAAAALALERAAARVGGELSPRFELDRDIGVAAAPRLALTGGAQAAGVFGVVDAPITVVVEPVAACGRDVGIGLVAVAYARAAGVIGKISAAVGVVVFTVGARRRRGRISLVVITRRGAARLKGEVHDAVAVVVEGV